MANLSDLVAPKPRGILSDFATGYNREGVSGLLGAPVDMATMLANLLIAGGGYVGHKAGILSTPPELIDNSRAVGSSDWIYNRLPNQPALSGSKAETAGRISGALMSPPVAMKSAPVLTKAMVKALQEKAPQMIDDFMSLTGGKVFALPKVTDIPGMSVGPSRVKPQMISESAPLYRETDTGGLDDLLRADHDFDFHNVFVADRPELAIGQGKNKGVFIEFRPGAVSGVEHRKPGTGDIFGREYQADIFAPKAVQSITFNSPADLKKLGGLTRRRLAGFEKETLPDGRIKFTRKPE